MYTRVKVSASSCRVGLGRVGVGVGEVVGLAPSVGVGPHRPVPLVVLGGEGAAVDGELHKKGNGRYKGGNSRCKECPVHILRVFCLSRDVANVAKNTHTVCFTIFHCSHPLQKTHLETMF